MSEEYDAFEKTIIATVDSLNRDISVYVENHALQYAEPHISTKKSLIDEAEERRNAELEKLRKYLLEKRGFDSAETQKQRDHEREMKIIDHEIARENRLAAEATAKVAANAQEQASQSIDGLLKGLQDNGEG